MTYRSYEDSVADGRVDELYDYFAPDTGEHWRVTSNPEAITYLTHEYATDEVERGRIKLAKNEFINNLEVKHGRAFALAGRFISGPVESRVQLTLFRGHLGGWVQHWHGELQSVSWDNDGIPTFLLEPRSSKSRRVGRRRRAQRLCDHALYDSGCRVNQDSFKLAGTLSNIVSLVLSSSTFGTKADGWFEGGKIQVGNEIRLIKTHVVNDITITRILNDASIGDSFVVYAGCDHSPSICLSKFANKNNFGGEEFLPPKNPFAGSAVIYG